MIITSDIKIIRRGPSIWISTCAILFFAGLSAWAQVTLTVSPSVISNTYTGFITLNIGGLTNGQTAKVLTYLDLNGNGIVDPGEPLIDAFKITDNGTNGIYGTVTNVNIPIDSNPAGGAITVTLNFAPPFTLGNIVGQEIFTIIAPTNPPVTATLIVTNATTSQSVSGTVFNGGTPVPNAVVIALLDPNTDYAGGAVADNNGHYSLNLNPGIYQIISTGANSYADQSVAPQVTLTNGAAVVTNLFMTNGLEANTISGQIYDSVSSNGVGGVFLQVGSGNLLSVAFTDTNGNYSSAVSPGYWKIKPAKERLARRALAVSQSTLQVNATSGSVANQNVELYDANALIYGRITDNSGAPLPNIQFSGSDANNQFSAKGYSDAAGYYAVAVLGLTNDDWFCSANGSETLTNYIQNSFNGVALDVGQGTEEDYVVLPIVGHITGHVMDNSGHPVVGVGLYADDGSYQSLDADTDSSGNYSLGVADGSWGVYFVMGGGSGLDTAGYEDLYGPYDVDVPPDNSVVNITVYPSSTTALSHAMRLSPQQFSFEITGATNVNYVVEASTNLVSGPWSSVSTLQLTNSPFQFVDTRATNTPRFYRVVTEHP